MAPNDCSHLCSCIPLCSAEDCDGCNRIHKRGLKKYAEHWTGQCLPALQDLEFKVIATRRKSGDISYVSRLSESSWKYCAMIIVSMLQVYHTSTHGKMNNLKTLKEVWAVIEMYMEQKGELGSRSREL
jgi:hypothetical protein